MDFSENQLEMVAICSDGLVFKENRVKSNFEELKDHRFVTIFEPINQAWLDRTTQTDEKSERGNADTKEPPKDLTYDASINKIDVYLTLKGYTQTS